MDSTLRRTWAEIDMDALAHNYETLRKRIGENVKFLGVVKADAYGHGSVQVSRLLQESGADYLAVSSIDEAVELRHNGITMPVLILGHTPKEEVSELIKNNITQAVTCRAKALEYSEEAVRYGGTSYLTTDLTPKATESPTTGFNTKFTDCNDTVTPKEEVNLRNKPSVTDADSVIVATAKKGELFTRTGYNTEVGWSRVIYNGQTLYCVTSLLSIQ